MADKILLFIPMYNCEKQITRVLEQLTDEVQKYISQVIIVNNRSTDNGEKAVTEHLSAAPLGVPVALLRNDENYGLGGSHKVAFNYAVDNGFDYVIVLHGDDQGSIADFLPILKNGMYRQYDCCLGSRFMKGSKPLGYSMLRKIGNYGFNFIFSIVARKKITDLGSGLNMYKVSSLENQYYFKFPDTLYFNDCMILAQCHMKQKLMFVPISWREEDQVSNNKLTKFAISLLKMCGKYIAGPDRYINSEMRDKIIKNYTCKEVYSNINKE